jgi:ribonuclease BN (tRNA processing enzyme)
LFPAIRARSAAAELPPSNTTYMLLSHYHGNHVANANLFAGSTWIVRNGDRDVILGPAQGAAADCGSSGRLTVNALTFCGDAPVLEGAVRNLAGISAAIYVSLVQGTTASTSSLGRS